MFGALDRCLAVDAARAGLFIAGDSHLTVASTLGRGKVFGLAAVASDVPNVATSVFSGLQQDVASDALLAVPQPPVFVFGK